MLTFSIVAFVLYFGMVIYILPGLSVSFDLVERRFRLLPHGFKYVAIGWFLIAAILIALFRNSLPKYDELLISNINIALFMFYFSKRKNEDEFSEQLRFKAFTYSFVSFVAIIGAVGALNVTNTDSSWSNFIVHGYFGGAILVATLYFYFTVYRLKKENM